MMRDPALSLLKYGLKNGSTVLMLKDVFQSIQWLTDLQRSQSVTNSTQKLNKTPSTASVSLSRTESLVLQRLESIVVEARESLVPMIEKYKTDAQTVLAARRNEQPKLLKDSHAKLGELLMQSLLKVDGVTFDSSFEMARLKRKQTVAFFQDLLDTIDGLHHQIQALSSD
jgi:hypothetical protein